MTAAIPQTRLKKSGVNVSMIETVPGNQAVKSLELGLGACLEGLRLLVQPRWSRHQAEPEGAIKDGSGLTLSSSFPFLLEELVEEEVSEGPADWDVDEEDDPKRTR